MNKETINDRVEMLVNERFNGNEAAFAKAMGWPPTIMSTYLEDVLSEKERLIKLYERMVER